MRHEKSIPASGRYSPVARILGLAALAVLFAAGGCLTTDRTGSRGSAAPVVTDPVTEPSNDPSEPVSSAVSNSQNAASPPSITNTSSIIRPGFVLRIGVVVAAKKEFEENALRVSDGGEVKLPFLGSIKVGGLSLAELTDRLTKDYSEYFVNPQLSVDFVADEKSAPWGSITILGRVKNPGRIALPPTRDFKVSAAIQSAGGFDTSADQSDIRITHPLPDGTTKTARVNLKAVGARGAVDQDLVLENGDVIFVPELIF